KTAIEETVEVKVNSLDELIARKEIAIDANRLSFIKLDAEGSEPLILKGMSSLLSTAKPVLFMEVNYDSLPPPPCPPPQLQGLLHDLQLDIYQLEYHFYLRNFRLIPVADLNSLRLSRANFTNIVSFRKSDSGAPKHLSRLISRDGSPDRS